MGDTGQDLTPLEPTSSPTCYLAGPVWSNLMRVHMTPLVKNNVAFYIYDEAKGCYKPLALDGTLSV